MKLLLALVLITSSLSANVRIGEVVFDGINDVYERDAVKTYGMTGSGKLQTVTTIENTVIVETYIRVTEVELDRLVVKIFNLNSHGKVKVHSINITKRDNTIDGYIITVTRDKTVGII